MSKVEGGRAMRAMAGSEKKEKESGKTKHKVHTMSIRHGAKGGFIVSHHNPAQDGMPQQEAAEHPIMDMAGLQQHVAQNLGDGEPAQGASPDQAVGAAQAAPAQGEPGQ